MLIHLLHWKRAQYRLNILRILIPSNPISPSVLPNVLSSSFHENAASHSGTDFTVLSGLQWGHLQAAWQLLGNLLWEQETGTRVRRDSQGQLTFANNSATCCPNGTHAYQRRSDLRICFFRVTPSDILGENYVLQLSCHFWPNQLNLLNLKIGFPLTTSIGLSMNFTIHESVGWFKPKNLCTFLFYLFVEEITEISRPHMQPAKVTPW